MGSLCQICALGVMLHKPSIRLNIVYSVTDIDFVYSSETKSTCVKYLFECHLGMSHAV